MIHRIFQQFDAIESAYKSECKRKTVVASYCLATASGLYRLCTAVNAPSGLGCSGVVGACGCTHAEPQLSNTIFESNLDKVEGSKLILVTHLPCHACASILEQIPYDLLIWKHDAPHWRGVERLLKNAYSLGDLNEAHLDHIKEWH